MIANHDGADIPAGRGRWVLLATILGSAMAFIDGSAVNVALPVLQTSLGANVSESQWVIDAYLLVLSSLMLAGGALGDRFGRVRIFAIGVAFFAAASAWCGAAPNAAQLIAARALQGIGAALLVPGSLAIITAAFPRAQRGRAIGTWSAMTALAIIAGPLLGGWLVQAVSWRAVFYINVPIAAATLFAVWLRVPRFPPTLKGAIDWLGTALITLSLGAITFALIEGPGRGWRDAVVIAAEAVAVVAFVVFFVVERRARDPIVPLSLFRSRNFTGANVLTLLLYAALSGALFLLPFNLIQVQHDSPAKAGAAFMPFVVTMSLLSRFTGALADRIGARLPLIAGPLVAAAGFALMAVPGIGGSYWTTFFPGIATLGIGMAITVAPLTTTVMTSIDDERHAGAASGINNTVSRVAGLLAIAIFGAIAVTLFARDLDRRLAFAGDNVRRAMRQQSLKLAAAAPPRDLDPATRTKVAAAVDAAFVHAFRVDMILAAVIAAASAGGALVIKSSRTRRVTMSGRERNVHDTRRK
ncbi:MAG TPA: MFS transporter [Thermoanaerobaculia bacterium]|nr:MFS transporter [Thermoanaerobaculia bacterium]